MNRYMYCDEIKELKGKTIANISKHRRDTVVLTMSDGSKYEFSAYSDDSWGDTLEITQTKASVGTSK